MPPHSPSLPIQASARLRFPATLQRFADPKHSLTELSYANAIHCRCFSIHCPRQACRCRFKADTYNASLCHCPSFLRPRIAFDRQSIAIHCLSYATPISSVPKLGLAILFLRPAFLLSSIAMRSSAKAVRYIARAMPGCAFPCQCFARRSNAVAFLSNSMAPAFPRYASAPLLTSAAVPCGPCDSTAFHVSSSAVLCTSMPLQFIAYAFHCLRVATPRLATADLCHSYALHFRSGHGSAATMPVSAIAFLIEALPLPCESKLHHYLCSISSQTKRPRPAFRHCPSPLYCP